MDITNKILRKYINKFKKLRRDAKNGGSPHKPIMLLSVIEQIRNNHITNNQIYITPELIATFKKKWSLLVTTPHELRFALPFYHLKGESFWYLIPNIGFEEALKMKGNMRSLRNLSLAVKYAVLNEDLFLLLCQSEERKQLEYVLLKTYFPDTYQDYYKIQTDNTSYIRDIESELLEESSEVYRLKYKLITSDEEMFVRGALFKRIVPRIYNYTCCISELRVSLKADISMIDACHIRQFSETKDDTIKNGFTLCPNLHRAFDRGLISIDDNYQVIISQAFIENNDCPYNITQFKGKKILLPENPIHYPSIDNFKWHRENKFLK